MRRRGPAVAKLNLLAFVVAVVLAACGRGGTPKVKGGVSTTTSTTTAVDFCTVARDYVTRTEAALSKDLQDARAHPEMFQGKVRDDFQAADKQNADLAASAPAAIKADMDYIATAFHAFVEGLDTAGYDPMKVSPDAYQRLQDPRYYDASRRVNAYAQEACGVETSSTTETSTTVTTPLIGTVTSVRPRVATTVRRGPSVAATVTSTSGVRRSTTTAATALLPTTEPPTEPPSTAPPSTAPPTTAAPVTTPPTTQPSTTDTSEPD